MTIKDCIFYDYYWETQRSDSSEGTMKDVMHPQARYGAVQRVHDQLVRVEGCRPRAFNLGVKHFDVLVVPVEHLRVEGSQNTKGLVDNLEKYLLNR